ncbi:Uma2 family endonuclease [Actinoplanes sp. TRM 88003]|uniref:Uma2 family endonuclease n=1 Tax=Paractinoplanes aksuensis TaxID=2939490 RepID=A0ABT1DG96_9ACTN|nr:Uma2 family endonuclease [Actinoplanes aksuensis]MCO8269819.1 Uma2 family endonuclease [Actinoplanes aksuensis]
MTAPSPNPFGRAGPWTELEYLALGETPTRIELIDGRLRQSPLRNVAHQAISHLVRTSLGPSARAADLKIFGGINVRVGSDRILIPDLAVVRLRDRTAIVVDAADVILIGEVVPTGHVAVDYGHERRALWRSGKVDSYLLIEPRTPDYDGLSLHLFRLGEGNEYTEAARAEPGGALVTDMPFRINLGTDGFIDF